MIFGFVETKPCGFWTFVYYIYVGPVCDYLLEHSMSEQIYIEVQKIVSTL